MINYQCQGDLDSCAIAVITVISSHPVTVSNKRLLYCCRMWLLLRLQKGVLLSNLFSDWLLGLHLRRNLAVHGIKCRLWEMF